MPFVYSVEAQQTIPEQLTSDRLSVYLARCRGDVNSSILLYEYNTKISALLFGTIQGLEVAFRNSCHEKIQVGLDNPQWYDTITLEERERASVNKAKKTLLLLGKQVTPGRVVAELTLGFWVRLLAPSYEKPIWIPHVYKALPNIPKPDRAAAFARMEHIRKLRNRIAHHEPIFSSDLRTDYMMIMEAVNWICQTTSAWMRCSSSVMLQIDTY